MEETKTAPTMPCLLSADAPHLNRTQRKYLASIQNRIEWLHKQTADRIEQQKSFILLVRERQALEWAIQYILENPPR